MKLISTLLLLAGSTAWAADDCYQASASAGEVRFSVTQSGAPFSGTFRQFNGEVCFSQGRLTRIDATLDPASIDTGLPELDLILKDKEFFAVREFPKVIFKITAAQSQGNTHKARGTLEIKGQRRDIEVTLQTTDSAGKKSIAGSLTLDRLQYGVGTGEWANPKYLGAEVRLDVKANLTRKP